MDYRLIHSIPFHFLNTVKWPPHTWGLGLWGRMYATFSLLLTTKRLFSTDLWLQRSLKIVRIESMTFLRYSNERKMELPWLRTRYIDLLFCCGRKTLSKDTSHQCSSTLHESGIHSKMTCILFVSLKFEGPVESKSVV